MVKGRGIKSIGIAGRLLSALVTAGRPLSLTELSERAEVNVSQVHTYLTSLRRYGLVEQGRHKGRYRVGATAMPLAMSRMRSIPWQRELVQSARDLSNELETMILVVAWGPYGPAVTQILNGHSSLNLNMRLGTVLSITSTASGQIFGAYGATQEIADRMSYELGHGEKAVQIAENLTSTKFSQLMDMVRRAGYAKIIGSPIPNVNAAAVPVFGEQGEICFALTLVDFGANLDVDHDTDKLLALKQLAARISQLALGEGAHDGTGT